MDWHVMTTCVRTVKLFNALMVKNVREILIVFLSLGCFEVQVYKPHH